MSVTRLLTDSCLVEAPTYGTDAHGQTVTAWTPLEAATPCRVDQTTGTEDLTDGPANFRRVVLIVAADVAITDAHRVTWNGTVWKVVSVDPVRGRAAVHHLEATMEATT